MSNIIVTQQDTVVQDSVTKEFAKLLEESFEINQINEGKIVKGTVISIESDLVIVDVGLKTEGRISLSEFSSNDGTHGLEIGDQVDVYLERIENALGDAVLSRDKAKREENWFKLEEDQKNNVIVEGIINGKVRGGFTVDIDGTQAFLPGSQVDVRPVKDIRPFMNTPQSFHILKMDKKRGNIVVSRKSVLSDNSSIDKSEILNNLNDGQEVEGIVKNITDYGAFVDLGGGVDGLLHVTDISWKRINKPSEVINIGDKVKVKILKIIKEDMKISLGMKQLLDDPWLDSENKYIVGNKYKGLVTNMADYGAFVQVDGGLEGLVHVSEMSWVSKVQKPENYVSIGDELEVMVLEIDIDKKDYHLALNNVDNPWENFAQKNPIGTVLKGNIQNITDFGIFVQVEEGLDGLVHLSDIDWKVPGEIAIKEYNVGQEIEAKILDFEIDKERISLGIKQLDDDPIGDVDLKKGSVVTCTVISSAKGGIDVEIGEGFPAFIKEMIYLWINLNKIHQDLKLDKR